MYTSDILQPAPHGLMPENTNRQLHCSSACFKRICSTLKGIKCACFRELYVVGFPRLIDLCIAATSDCYDVRSIRLDCCSICELLPTVYTADSGTDLDLPFEAIDAVVVARLSW